MNLARIKTSPRTKIWLDGLFERLGVRIRKVQNFPLSTSPVLHQPALRHFGAAPDGTGAVLFDVGAHLGETALALAGDFPGATIHAFEPISQIFERLTANCRHLPHISCHRLALGNENVTRRIALSSADVDCTTNQMSRPAGADTPAPLSETITIARLDDFCARQQIQKIALLKTDTEGFELEVLAGAQQMLQQGRIASVLVEVTFLDDNPQHVPFEKVRQVLAPHGFKLMGLYDHGYRPHNGEMWYTNALFNLPPS